MDKYDYAQALIGELKLQRVPFEANWREISDYLLPFRLRMNLSDYGKGDRRNSNIYNSSATHALRTLESGFMLSVTNPGDVWFRLKPEDQEAYDFGPVGEWLDDVASRMMGVFERSNLYLTLPTFYGNFAGFGTAALSLEPHYEGEVIHARTIPTGSYWIGQDQYSTVNTFYREFRMTIRQLRERFPKGDFSTHVKDMLSSGKRWEEWVDVGHLVYPNEDYDPESPLAGRKKFGSCWFEIGMSSATSQGSYLSVTERKFIDEGGFDEFPFLVARWALTEGEVYGIDCPGMTCFGDIKSLQFGEKRSWQAVEKHVNPHWLVPESLKRAGDKGFIAGDMTYIDDTDSGKGIRPIYEIKPEIQQLEAKLEQVRKRIFQTLDYDLFRMFDLIEDRERTAAEISERRNEKLTQLVPMLGQLHRGVFRPLIDRTFRMMWAQGLIPPPPPELEGKRLTVEYVGVLAQAQRAAAAGPVERLIATVLPAVQAMQDPALLDKIEWDNALDVVATALGAPARVVRSNDEVAAIRQARAQAQAQAAQLEAMKEGAQAAKNLSQADMGSDNALTRMARMNRAQQGAA